MNSKHPKSVRRRILIVLYDHYVADPLHTLTAADIMTEGPFNREDLIWNAYFLYDRGLIEIMIGYNPPLFTGARITAAGIELVENHFEFNLRFPAAPGDAEQDFGEVPLLVERLVEEADLSSLDGEARKSLLRDVQYLRDELSRPADRWRPHVVHTLLDWMGGYAKENDGEFPSLALLNQALRKL